VLRPDSLSAVVDLPNPVGREYFLARFPIAISFVIMGTIGLVMGIEAGTGGYGSGIGSTNAFLLAVLGAFVTVAGCVRLWESARISRSMPKTVQLGSDGLTVLFEVKSPEGGKTVSRLLPFASVDDVKPLRGGGLIGTASSGVFVPAAAYGTFEPPADGKKIKLFQVPGDMDTRTGDLCDVVYLWSGNYDMVRLALGRWKRRQQASTGTTSS